MGSTESLSQHRFVLNNGGGEIPALGFGTSLSDNTKTRNAVKTAVEVGFRHLDAAERYRNEAEVGAALKDLFADGAVRREELFVTTKLWNNNHRPERVKAAFEASLRRLQLDYLDCYLVHTPFAFKPGDEFFPVNERSEPIYDTEITLIETWRAMEKLVDEGRCRAIGLSDITLDKLKEVVAVARIMPSVVQVESHPYLPEWELLEFCRQNGIVLLAFAPLGHGMEPRITDDEVIKAVAKQVGKTPAQVALAWAAQRGTAFLTTSTNPDHIRENFDVSWLPEELMQEITERVTTVVRLNPVVNTGVPGFVPRSAP